jgi:hypothetical protein
MSDKIFEALGATDEAHALRIIAEFKSAATALHALTGREAFALSLPVVQAKFTFAASVETKTGKAGQDAVMGVLEVWKDSHDGAAKTAADLSSARVELEGMKFEKVISDAKAACKLTPAGEAKYRQHFTNKTLALAGIETALELTDPNPALVNARTLHEPAVAPTAGGAPVAAGVDPTKKYEDYTALELSNLRDSGAIDKTAYAALRQDWSNRGKPAIKTAA